MCLICFVLYFTSAGSSVEAFSLFTGPFIARSWWNFNATNRRVSIIVSLYKSQWIQRAGDFIAIGSFKSIIQLRRYKNDINSILFSYYRSYVSHRSDLIYLTRVSFFLYILYNSSTGSQVQILSLGFPSFIKHVFDRKLKGTRQGISWQILKLRNFFYTLFSIVDSIWHSMETITV